MTRRYNPVIKGILHKNKLQKRRATLYKMLAKKHDGIVPCYVCGKHVTKQDASLEHIIPLAKGGTDDMENLSISHVTCNNARSDGE